MNFINQKKIMKSVEHKIADAEIIILEEVDGVVVHSLGFSAEGSGFESRPGPSESIK